MGPRLSLRRERTTDSVAEAAGRPQVSTETPISPNPRVILFMMTTFRANVAFAYRDGFTNDRSRS